ncbi:hypothetical protein BDW62DRAFT_179108 [Aspergillus aurantiobrunneus]
MSCLSGLLSCCLPTKSIESTQKHETRTVQPSSTNSTTQSPNPISNHDISALEPPQNGYNQIVPLPAYTPRPVSIHEKTLAAHMRDPPISNETCQSHLNTDKKQRLAWEEAANSPDYYPYSSHPRPEEVSSDVSSAVSFPSSYGNTSTATRETPPPPYSPPNMSPAPSRSMSISSAYRRGDLQMPMAALTQPPPAFTRSEAGRSSGSSMDEQITSPISPLNSRPGRWSWESEHSNHRRF